MTGNEAVVLLVDDDEAKRYLMGTWLRRAGHTVIEAGTGREALAKAGSAEHLGGRMRVVVVIMAAVLAGGSATLAVAQHQHGHDMTASGAPDRVTNPRRHGRKLLDSARVVLTLFSLHICGITSKLFP